MPHIDFSPVTFKLEPPSSHINCMLLKFIIYKKRQFENLNKKKTNKMRCYLCLLVVYHDFLALCQPHNLKFRTLLGWKKKYTVTPDEYEKCRVVRNAIFAIYLGQHLAILNWGKTKINAKKKLVVLLCTEFNYKNVG